MSPSAAFAKVEIVLSVSRDIGAAFNLLLPIPIAVMIVPIGWATTAVMSGAAIALVMTWGKS